MKEQKKENQFSGMTREEIVLEAKKQIVRSAFLALAALIVIGVACYAWFVSAGMVTAEVGTVSLHVGGFELATAAAGDGKGEYEKYKGYLDPNLPEAETLSGEIWQGKTAGWTKGNQTILWRVDQDSNFANAGENVGIRPGSEGNLTFYVIPKVNGQMHIKCYMSLRPVMKTQQTNEEKKIMDHEAIATQLLRGHILFDQCIVTNGIIKDGETELTEEQIEAVKNGYFEIVIEDAKANEPVKYDIKWFWPYVLREANEHSVYGAQIRNLTGRQNLSDYFYFKTKMDLNGKMVRDTVDVSAALPKDLSIYYNSADQFIGDYIDGVVLELTADLA